MCSLERRKLFCLSTRREKKKSVPKKANFQQVGHKITGKSPQKTERNGKSVPKKANFQQTGQKTEKRDICLHSWEDSIRVTPHE